MDISVIIPTYNRASMLPGLLECWSQIDAHTNVTYELIFSDDGSDDDTLDVLAASDDLPLVILSNEHGGASAARNSAIEVARGKRLLFLGDDVYPSNDILEVHVSIGLERGEDVAVQGLVDWHPEQRQNYLLRHITEVGNEQFSFNRLQQNAFTDFRHFYTCNVSVGRAMLDKEEVKFDKRFYKVNFEDTELSYRLSKHGMKIFYTPKAYGLHYHEYDSPGFCRRQVTAGEMSVVLRGIHPELDKILGLADIERDYDRYLKLNGIEENNRSLVRQVLQRADEYECRLSNNADTKEQLQGLLSIIYRQLFQLKFYEGALTQHKDYNEKAVANFLYDRYFGEQFVAALLDHANCAGVKRLLMSDSKSECERNIDLVSSAYTGVDLHDVSIKLPFAVLKRRAKKFLRRFKIIRYMRQVHLNRHLTKVEAPFALDAEPVCLSMAIVGNVQVLQECKKKYKDIENINLIYVDRVEGVESIITGCDYVYDVGVGQRVLEAWQIRNVFLMLCNYQYDYVFVSLSYEEIPVVGLSESTAQLIQRREMWMSAGIVFEGAKGKIIRLQPAPEDLIEEVFASPGVAVDCDGQVEASNGSESLIKYNYSYSFKVRESESPIIFVLPIFLAVGGAERNIIEVMRELSSRYKFIVITMERHSKDIGSLHHQVAEFTESIYDLAEIAPQGGFLHLLAELNSHYKPESVLVTNGSPWLLANSKNIRQLFADIPVIDHQVYDHNEGWIQHYSDPGIQSFDRFVAINKKIQTAMLDDKGLTNDRVCQIYHVVDIGRIQEFKQNPVAKKDIMKEFRLPADKPLYIMIARLSPQKRPEDFLAFVKKRQQLGGKEHFILVGDGILREDVARIISSSQLSNVTQVQFVNNPIRLISIAEAMIFTSEYEGLPVAMLEALSLGVPIFSTDVGDIAEVLGEYDAGMTFACDSDIEAYSNSFELFLGRQAGYQESLKENKLKIADRFCPQSIAAQYQELFVEAKLNFRKSV